MKYDNHTQDELAQSEYWKKKIETIGKSKPGQLRRKRNEKAGLALTKKKRP
jgi:hypothetical protein